MKEDILGQYQRRRNDLEALTVALKEDLGRMLASVGLEVNAVFARIKSAESLKGKLARPDRTYESLDQVTDLIGLRVVTYFEDGVRDVADVLEKNYTVDFQHSIDKGTELNPTQFGYRSLHYICVVPNRLLPSDGLKGARFEVQIRSILQHAWAQMEHDLGYKSSESVPLAFRRRFSRLAGLLELVDEEFVALRQALEGYSRELQTDLTSVPVDSFSLSTFVRTPLVREVDAMIAEWLQAEVTDEVFYPEYLTRVMSFVGVKDIGELSDRLQRRKGQVQAALEPYFKFSEKIWGLSRHDIKTVERGYCLLFLAHVLLLLESRLELERLERLTAFYKAIDYPKEQRQARQVALMLLEAFSDWTEG